MARQIRFPTPRLPNTLPFEDRISAALDRLANSISRSPVSAKLRELSSQMPYIVETELSTPFGKVMTPELSMPALALPQIDGRKKEAMKAAIGTDLAQIIGLVPVLGDVLADILEDTYAVKIRETLTPEEEKAYMHWDKLGPSTLAMMRTFARR